nr:bifunctional isocitrate dehydrogenase kinase/phosphatase [Desulfobacterales bacterium]
MTEPTADIVAAVLNGFEAYRVQFAALTVRARTHFRNADWQGMRADAAQRLDIYQQCLDRVVDTLSENLPQGSNTRDVWRQAKDRFETQAAATGDADLAETFFNSIARRMLETIGIDPHVEFVRSQAPALAALRPNVDCRTYRLDG